MPLHYCDDRHHRLKCSGKPAGGQLGARRSISMHLIKHAFRDYESRSRHCIIASFLLIMRSDLMDARADGCTSSHCSEGRRNKSHSPIPPFIYNKSRFTKHEQADPHGFTCWISYHLARLRRRLCCVVYATLRADVVIVVIQLLRTV